VKEMSFKCGVKGRGSDEGTDGHVKTQLGK